MTVKDESYKLSKQRNCIIEIGNLFEENITDYITSVDVNHTLNGDTYLINEINPSSAGFQVKNYGDYFKNKQLSKLPIKIKSGYNGKNEEVFRGYLKRDSYRVGSKELSLSSESYLQVFKKEILNKEILENFFIEDIVKRAIQECVTDGTPYELQRTGIIIPICNLNKYTQWSEIIKLLSESCGFVLVYEEQKFKWRKFWDSTQSSVYNFNVDNIKDLVQTKSIDDIKNTILLVSNYESVAPEDKLSESLVSETQVDGEIYYIQEGFGNRIKVQNLPLLKNTEVVDGETKYKTDTTVFIVDGNSSRFGQRILVDDMDENNGYIYLAEHLPTGMKLSVSYKYLQLQLNPGQERTYIIELNSEARNIQLLCAAWKNTSEFDSGERVPFSTIPASNTIHLTDSIEQKDNKIRFKLKNNTMSIVVISTLQVYGNPIKAFSPIKAKYKNPFSVTKYGEKQLEINNDFIVSEQQARDLGVFLYSNCSELIEKIEIQLPQHMPFLKIGDKVTVTENSTSINYDFMITSIRHSYNESEWSTSFNAIKYPKLLENIVPEYLTKDNQGDYITSSLFNQNPLTPLSNLKIQYNNNSDGVTKNISLSWTDIDDIQAPIDGYEIFISVKNSTQGYTVDFENDIRFMIRPEARGLILRNLPSSELIDATEFSKYYAFAIRPFRNVHPEISPDGSGMLKGEITYFTNTYKKITDFTPYNGSQIEQSVNGVIETTSISILNTILHSVQQNQTYANSLRFDDFKGMRIIADTGNGQVDRIVAGQFAPQKFGMQIRNGDNDVVLQADETGLKLFNTDLTVARTDNKSRVLINPSSGIKIQTHNGTAWVDKLYADTNGALTLDGKIISTSGNIGGWDITSTGLKIGTGTSTRGIDSGSISFYAGSDTPSSAPFRVGIDGSFTATKATISGTLHMGAGSTIDWNNVNAPPSSGGLTKFDPIFTYIDSGGVYSGKIWGNDIRSSITGTGARIELSNNNLVVYDRKTDSGGVMRDVATFGIFGSSWTGYAWSGSQVVANKTVSADSTKLRFMGSNCAIHPQYCSLSGALRNALRIGTDTGTGDGDVWLEGTFNRISNPLIVYNGATFRDNLSVYGTASVGGNLTVAGSYYHNGTSGIPASQLRIYTSSASGSLGAASGRDITLNDNSFFPNLASTDSSLIEVRLVSSASYDQTGRLRVHNLHTDTRNYNIRWSYIG